MIDKWIPVSEQIPEAEKMVAGLCALLLPSAGCAV